MSDPERSLRVISTDGMCNRLLVLLSGRAIAGATRRRFAMEWLPALTCNCPFELLFENEWNVESREKASPGDWQNLRMMPPGKFPNLLRSTEPHLRVSHHAWLFDTQLYPEHRALEERAREMIGGLRPVAAIREQVETFKRANFRSTMIGVHLRRGDFTTARPELVGNLEASLKAVDEWLKQAPEAGILLCTDDGAPIPHAPELRPQHGVREIFRERYGERVVIPTPSSLDRASPIAIQDALAELWLLRQTQYLVGTLDSTFSYLAGFGRNVPTIMCGGMSREYAQRQRLMKLTGAYYVLLGLGKLEFGRKTPYRYAVRVYKGRIARLKGWLRR